MDARDYERAAELVAADSSLSMFPADAFQLLLADHQHAADGDCVGGPGCVVDAEVRSVLERAGGGRGV